MIAIPTDFQVPLEVIPELVKKWEDGAKIVCLVEASSEEKRSCGVFDNYSINLVIN